MNEQVINVTPAALAGVSPSDSSKTVTPEAQDILDRLKAHYQGLGKPSAAQNYSRHLKSFFLWAEQQGYGIRSLPQTAVEDFLAALSAAGQKEATVYVMRTQLKSALRECHNVLGVDFAHLEYQTGKPREVRRAQKEREKQKRREVNTAKTLMVADAIRAAQQHTGLGHVSVPSPHAGRFDPLQPAAFAPPVYTDHMPLVSAPFTPEEYPVMSDNAPVPAGSQASGAAAPAAAAQSGQPTIVVNMPQQQSPARATTTIGATKPTATTAPATGPRGVVLNNHTFTGPYIKISRMADGTDPLTPPGTETYVTTLPLTQLAPHGDVAGFLQSFIVPNLRLSPLVSQVHFVFHELNERKQPTGRRDEMIVSLPMSMTQQGQQAQAGNAFQMGGFGPMGMGFAPQAPASPQADGSTDRLLRRYDEEAAEAKKKADELQAQLRTEKDAHTTFLLMQQFQQVQDLRKELEERKQVEIARLREPPPMPPMPMYMPPPMPEPRVEVMPREDTGAAMAKAFADSQAKMMEVIMAGMAANRPQVQPQKDVAEWLVPMMTSMQQLSMQQQQASQQMLVGIMQSNQQFMQALLTKESPETRILLEQIKEVKAAAAAPKEDEVESFAEKLQKMKMVAEMMGGGGGGGSGMIGELLANAEQIGNGVAAIMAASKGSTPAPAPKALAAAPVVQAPQLPAPAPQSNGPREVPESVRLNLDALVMVVQQGDEQAAVNAFIDTVKAMAEAEAPFPQVAQSILTGFANAEDEGELFTVIKGLFLVTGRQPDRLTCKSITAILAKWYAVIHYQAFGQPKNLADGSSIMQPEIPVDAPAEAQEDGDDEDEEDGDDDEVAAEGAVA